MDVVSRDECRGLLDVNKLITPDKNMSVPVDNGLTTTMPKNENLQDGDKNNSGNSQSRRSYIQDFLSTEIEDVTSVPFWRACLAEFLGTLLLCFYHIGVELFMPNTAPPPFLQMALAKGIFVAVLVSSLAAASGCHVNPAVSLGFASLRHISLVRTVAYMIFQCIGGITGTFLLRGIINPDMVGKLGLTIPADGITDTQAIAMEIILTSFLQFMNVAMVDKARTDIQGSVPLIVGLTVLVNTILGGPVSGGCMNPARALGPAVVLKNFGRHWIYWVGPCVGGLIGSLLYDRLFSAGIFGQCSPTVCLCGPRSAEYSRAVRKEAVKMASSELETVPEDRV